MDWDLWGPPNDIVAEESGFDNSQRDFYFDLIEEAALNEKYCVRVLRILIKKADTEILELEQDLLSLQTELAWVENEDWPDVCCNALREKIDFLDISIKKLRNKDKNDIEVRLLMYTQPVETLDEIMKAVFRNYICKKDKQLKDAIVMGSSSDAPRHTGLDKEKRLSNCNLETITSENTKDCSSTPTEHGAALSPSLNLQEKKTGNSEPTSADIKGFSPQSSEVAPDFSDENKSLSFWGPRSTGKRDAREHGVAPRDEKLIQSSSSKSTHNGRHGLKPVKVEPTENSVSNSTIYALENAVVLSYKEKPGDSDSTATKEVEEHSSISTPDVVISSSSTKPMAKKTDLRKTVKPAGAIIKNVSAEALRRAAGLNGKKYNSDCALGTFKQANCSGSDTGQKLCEFAPTAAQKRIVKESKIAAAHDIVSLKSPQKTNGKNKSRLIVKLRETDLTGTENCALTSLLEMQDHEGKNAAKLQPDEEKPTLAEIQMTEISAHEERSNMKLFSNPQKEKGKRNIKSNPPILHEIGFSKLMHNSSSTSISESNKKRKSRVGPQNSSLNQTLSENITKKAVRPDKGEAKDHGAATDCTPNSLSEPRNKKKECVNFPHLSGIEDSSVQLDLSSSLGDTIDARKDDLSAEKSCSTCDSSYEVVASGIADISNLKDLRLPKLRTIAGRLKLTRYSKLRKELLLELIAERLAN